MALVFRFLLLLGLLTPVLRAVDAKPARGYPGAYTLAVVIVTLRAL